MNPIEAAVMPLKSDAIKRAEAEAQNRIDIILDELAQNGWDLNLAAPRGSSLRDPAKTYFMKNAKHHLFESVTDRAPSKTYEPHPKNIRMKSEKNGQRFIDQAKKDAAVQYDEFVKKLTLKIGPVVSATLEGSHVWSHSILTVTKEDGTVEHWKTQMIVNVSKHGKMFHQWPTRKVKG